MMHERSSPVWFSQEINILNGRLESSRQLMLELEETARRSGQQSGDLAEMMKNAREASEAEFRRYMEEAEAKHSLNVRCKSVSHGVFDRPTLLATYEL